MVLLLRDSSMETAEIFDAMEASSAAIREEIRKAFADFESKLVAYINSTSSPPPQPTESSSLFPLSSATTAAAPSLLKKIDSVSVPPQLTIPIQPTFNHSKLEIEIPDAFSPSDVGIVVAEPLPPFEPLSKSQISPISNGLNDDVCRSMSFTSPLPPQPTTPISEGKVESLSSNESIPDIQTFTLSDGLLVEVCHSLSPTAPPHSPSRNTIVSGGNSEGYCATPASRCPAPAPPWCWQIGRTENVIRVFYGRAVMIWTEEPPGTLSLELNTLLKSRLVVRATPNDQSGFFNVGDSNLRPCVSISGIEELSGNTFFQLQFSSQDWSMLLLLTRLNCSLPLFSICGDKSLCLTAPLVKCSDYVIYFRIGSGFTGVVPFDLEYLAQFHDVKIRNEGEIAINHFRDQNLLEFLLSLFVELSNDGKPVVSRTLAGIVFNLNNSLDAKEAATKDCLVQQSVAIDISFKSQIKSSLLNTLGSSARETSHIAVQVVAKIASIGIPRKEWPELVGLVLANMTQPGRPASWKQSTLDVIGYVCEGISYKDLVQDEVNAVLTAVDQGINTSEQNSDVRFAAIRVLYNALNFAHANFENKMERNYIMNMICDAALANEVEIRKAAYEFLVSIAPIYYWVLEPYMQKIFELTSNAVKVDEEPVALQEVEFWSSNCEGESDIQDNEVSKIGSDLPHYQFIQKALPTLVPMLLETILKQDEDQDQEDGIWNLAMPGGTCLGLIAKTVGDDVVPLVMPFVESSIPKTDSQSREAATFAFGSILDGPTTIMKLSSMVLGCSSFTVYEEAMIAISAQAYATGPNFAKYMQEFYKYLEMGLQNFEEYEVCVISVVVVGYISRALDEKLTPYCVGSVTYQADLLEGCKIHPNFYISALRPFKEGPNSVVLPKQSIDSPPLLTPTTVVGSGYIIRKGVPRRQVLINWEGLTPEKSGLMGKPTVQLSLCPTIGGRCSGVHMEVIHFVKDELNRSSGCALVEATGGFTGNSHFARTTGNHHLEDKVVLKAWGDDTTQGITMPTQPRFHSLQPSPGSILVTEMRLTTYCSMYLLGAAERAKLANSLSSSVGNFNKSWLFVSLGL